MERKGAENRCRTPPNSRLFWNVQLAEFLDHWTADELIKVLEN
jgi:hypothetical protein